LAERVVWPLAPLVVSERRVCKGKSSDVFNSTPRSWCERDWHVIGGFYDRCLQYLFVPKLEAWRKAASTVVGALGRCHIRRILYTVARRCGARKLDYVHLSPCMSCRRWLWLAQMERKDWNLRFDLPLVGTSGVLVSLAREESHVGSRICNRGRPGRISSHNHKRLERPVQ